MGFWDTIVRTKKSTRSTAIDQDVQMGMPAGIGNIATNIRVPVDVDMPFNTRIDASKRADSRQWTTSNTYNPIYAPQDARSLMIITNSPNSSQKKADKTTGASVIPTFSQIPSMTTDLGATEIPVKMSPDLDFDLGTPSLTSSWVLLGLAGVGGYFIYKGMKANKSGAKK